MLVATHLIVNTVDPLTQRFQILRFFFFSQRAKDHPEAKRQTLHDLLVQPGQRIGRYTMMLKGNHPMLASLPT
jgi:hypothetical protein